VPVGPAGLSAWHTASQASDGLARGLRAALADRPAGTASRSWSVNGAGVSEGTEARSLKVNAALREVTALAARRR
jgi:hypothetical protein